MLRTALIFVFIVSAFGIVPLSAQELPPQSAVPPVCPVAVATETRTLAPGIELTTIVRQLDVPLRLFIVKVDPKAGGDKPQWKLQLATADYSVLKFSPVSEIAKRDNAAVAINGGYFAFGGAALGAVKIDGEWIRLPMKNRTAVGFNESGQVLIDNLEVTRGIIFGGGGASNHSRVFAPIENLNGFASENALCIVTPRFGSIYKLRDNESALQVEGEAMKPGKIVALISAGSVEIPSNGWLIIARGEIRNSLSDSIGGGRAQLGIMPKSRDWEKYPTILGAGPRLVKNGEIFTTEKEEEFRPDVLARGPRSAFGVDKDGHWIFLVADGREKEYSMGLSIPELAREMQAAGAIDALCLDGGGSSTLVINDTVLNRPSDGTERKVPNALLVVPTN